MKEKETAGVCNTKNKKRDECKISVEKSERGPCCCGQGNGNFEYKKYIKFLKYYDILR
jgi:hypothetical protein